MVKRAHSNEKTVILVSFLGSTLLNILGSENKVKDRFKEQVIWLGMSDI